MQDNIRNEAEEKLPLERINELANKAKTVGLTPEEKEEQTQLRQKYLEIFRRGMRAQLESIVLVDEKGNKRRLEKKDTK